MRASSASGDPLTDDFATRKLRARLEAEEQEMRKTG